MKAASRLPGDGAVGLITYMRTDSIRVSDEALAAVREYVEDDVRRGLPAGEAELLQDQVGRAGRARSDPPDVDAVRSGNGAARTSTPDQYSLYRLIWNRFVASQMPPATFDETTVDITAGDYLFRVKGTVPKFAGWMATYGLTPGEPEQKEPQPRAALTRGRTRDAEDDDAVSGVLPPLAEGDRLELKALRPEQKFTQPPPRFTEATLVKELEENGIGRPSTYASIISVLQDREYVNKIEGRFKPTVLGR